MLRKVSADGKMPAKAILTAQKEKGAQSISVSMVEGWRVGEVQDFIIFTTDGEDVVPGSVSSWTGVPAANGDITELTLTGGMDILYPIGAVVMPTATSSWANELISALLVVHNSDGSLKSEAIPKQEIPDESITADKIDFMSIPTYNYSTEEVDTGKKWIDGKTIYRKTVTEIAPVVAAGTEQGYSIAGIKKFRDIISVSGYVRPSEKDDVTNGTFIIPNGYAQNRGATSFAVWGTHPDVALWIYFSGNGSRRLITLTVEYTKN